MEPISTYVDFGEREYLVADERGYDYLLYKMAEGFLFTSEGRILNSRLKLNKVHTVSFFSFLSLDFLEDFFGLLMGVADTVGLSVCLRSLTPSEI